MSIIKIKNLRQIVLELLFSQCVRTNEVNLNKDLEPILRNIHEIGCYLVANKDPELYIACINTQGVYFRYDMESKEIRISLVLVKSNFAVFNYYTVPRWEKTEKGQKFISLVDRYKRIDQLDILAFMSDSSKTVPELLPGTSRSVKIYVDSLGQ